MSTKHIKFVEAPPKKSRARTKLFWVVSVYDETQLGWIAWKVNWRRYSFYPNAGTTYDENCLRDIAEFCASLTKAHKRAYYDDGAECYYRARVKEST